MRDLVVSSGTLLQEKWPRPTATLLKDTPTGMPTPTFMRTTTILICCWTRPRKKTTNTSEVGVDPHCILSLHLSNRQEYCTPVVGPIHF